MRTTASCNPLTLFTARVEHSAVFVAFVQGVIRPFHENFRPLDERSCEKTGERADQDLLEESGLHCGLESNESASKQGLFVDPSGTRAADLSGNSRSDSGHDVGHPYRI